MELAKLQKSTLPDYTDAITVNAEIFARILFSRIVLKDIFATLEIRDFGMIYVYQ